MYTLLKNFLHLFRSHRGYTWATVLTLGICLGACLAILGVVRKTLLVEPPYGNPSELVWVRSSMLSQKINPDLIRTISREPDFFKQFAAYSRNLRNALETGENRYSLANCTLLIGDIFHVLGVQPIIGRGFLDQDFIEGAEPAMIITHEFWQEAFGSNPDIFGNLHNLENHPVRLLGVLPPRI